jgi:hypothetical protein
MLQDACGERFDRDQSKAVLFSHDKTRCTQLGPLRVTRSAPFEIGSPLILRSFNGALGDAREGEPALLRLGA